MLEVARNRYPGAQPFTDDGLSRRLFRGRERECTALIHQILANRLVVLFARSGLGKTSLLNAGVAENLRGLGFLPLTVRVNNGDSSPLESLYIGIAAECVRQSVEYVPGEKSSLWHFFKTAQLWRGDILLKPVLILDQFEELFTLHAEQPRSTFLDQLSYVFRGIRPADSPSNLAGAISSPTDVTDTAPQIKVVVSLREDFLAYLEELSDRIPEILDQRFRLLPMDRKAASKAIEEPAMIEDPILNTRPFELDSHAKDTILDFLERRATTLTKRTASQVEPFQLQLICQHLEEIAERKQRDVANGTVKISLDDIGGESSLRRILGDFYARQISAIPSFFQRRGVRRLCSEFLISPQGRRLRMEESEVKRLTGVKPDTLLKLVDRRLLRVDQIAEGSYYELSHDSLISPVLDSRRIWFLLRAVALLVFTFMTFLIAVGIALGVGGIVSLGPKDVEGVLTVSVITLILLSILARVGITVIRMFRNFVEMGRRSRIW
jgi:hypothetical protein